MNEMKNITTIASLPSSPSSSKNSREVQDATEGFGDQAGCSGRSAGGYGGVCVYAGVLVAIAPAVCVKVRVMGV